MYRFLEIFPGALSWLTIVLMFAVSAYLPVYAAVFIILFDVHWLLRTMYMSFHLQSTFNEMRRRMRVNWIERLEREAARDARIAQWKEAYHLVILPMYKEPYEVVKESFDRLMETRYPKDKMIVALATEERAGEAARRVAEQIRQEFGERFFKFLVTVHPQDIAGEIPGKGSNETWAIKEVKRLAVDPSGIPYERIVVSVFDVDTQVSKEYFGVLTYAFLTAEKPQRSSYQPIPLYTNNIFQAPAIARVISLSSTFWQMMQQERPEQLVTFSSHAMPFKALVEIGYWQTDIVSEDSRIFWQFYLHYNGDWRVVPLFYPVSMDANAAPTFWKTLVNLYKQQRRWGWGVENFPYVVSGFLKNSRISLGRRLAWTYVLLEGLHSWATNALLIFLMGWLPLYLGGPDFNVTVLSRSLPQLTSTFLTLAMVGIITSAVISIALLPPKPAWFKRRHYFLFVFQWLLMPITLIVFGAFPALESQTRIILGGKYRLGFWVTPKHRRGQSSNL